MTTVLYLTGAIAIWLRFSRKGVLHEMHVDRLLVEQGQCVVGARWLVVKHPQSTAQLHEHTAATLTKDTAEDVQIQLVVDSNHEEIDIHPLLKSSSRLKQYSNKRALKKQLSHSFPDAIIHTVKKPAGLDAVLVQHINFTEQQRFWLEQLQKGNLTIASVRSVTEVLARFFTVDAKACLAVSYADGYVKHTFCQSGVAFFTRTVSKVAQKDAVTQLEETLTHLLYNKLITGPIPVLAVGMSDEYANLVRQLQLVSGLTMAETAFVDVFSSDVAVGNYLPQACVASQALLQPVAEAKAGSRHATSLLNKRDLQLRLQRKAWACAAAGAVFIGSVAFSGFEYAQHRKNSGVFTAEKNRLEQVIAQHMLSAQSITDQPLAVADVLLHKEALVNTAAASVTDVLTVVAGSLKSSRQLTLNEITWRIQSSGEMSNAQAPLSAIDTSTELAYRSEFNQQSTPNALVVRLSGSVMAGYSLTQQQALIVEFENRLKQEPNVYNLKVVAAPVSQLLDHASGGVEAVSTTPEFSIEFNLGRDHVEAT